MARIDGLEVLEDWLQGRDQEVSAAVSTRAALRVLPLVSGNWRSTTPRDEQTAVLLPSLRAAIVALTLLDKYDDQAKIAVLSAADGANIMIHKAANPVIENVIEALAYSTRGSTREFQLLKALAKRAPEQMVRGADFYDLVYAIECAVQAVAHAEEVKFFWNSLSADCTTFDEGKPVAAMYRLPLWFGSEIPAEIANALRRLDALFARDPTTWSFWRDWYQRVLDGAYQNQKLLYDIAILPNEDWEKGPEHIAGLIAEIEARHTVASRRTGERMVWDATPGELAFIATVPSSPKIHQDGLANILEEVAAFGDPDQLPQHHRALRDLLVDLKDRIGRYGENQQRMHELFLRELGNVRGMLATGEVVSDRRVSNLTGALDTTALDIRTTNADVMASHLRRIAGREAELSPERAVTLREIAGEIAQRGNAEVKEEIGTDIAIVIQVASDKGPVLRANKNERISAMDRTTRRLPEALIVMKDAGVELAPRVVNGATKGYAIGKMFADLMEVLRPYSGL